MGDSTHDQRQPITDSSQGLNRLGFIALALIMVCSGCASERATTPNDVSFVLYLGGDESETIYTVDTDSFSVIDSLPGIGTTQFIASSSDGKYLFVSCDHPTLGRSLLKISVATKSIVAHQPSIALFPPQVLDHGKLLLTYLDKRRILDAATFQPVSKIPDSLSPLPSVGAVTEVLARVVGGERYCLYDIVTGTTRGGYRPHLIGSTAFPPQLGHVVKLHAPTNRIGLFVRTSIGSYVLVGDMLTGETLLQHRVAYPFGDIAFSDDGQLMAVSDPSWPGIWDTPITIGIFDFRTLTHMKRLNSTLDFPFETCDRLMFVPNSHTLIAAPQLHWGFKTHVIDLETESIRVTKYLPYTGTPIGGMVMGPALN